MGAASIAVVYADALGKSAFCALAYSRRVLGRTIPPHLELDTLDAEKLEVTAWMPERA